MRIVFPTKENMSYISHSASNYDEANYLTVLDVQNENIVGVQTVKKNQHNDSEDFIKEFVENQYGAIVVPSNTTLPINALKEAGITIYNDEDSQVVLNAFNDYVHKKLIQA